MMSAFEITSMILTYRTHVRVKSRQNLEFAVFGLHGPHAQCRMHSQGEKHAAGTVKSESASLIQLMVILQEDRTTRARRIHRSNALPKSVVETKPSVAWGRGVAWARMVSREGSVGPGLREAQPWGACCAWAV